MRKRNIIILLLFLLLLLPLKIHAQSSNAGFAQGNIWYSVDPFSEGDKIKIYTVVFNPDPREFSGSVVFFDDSVLLGKVDFVLPAQTAKEVSINWTVGAGDHTIFAKIENARFLVSPGRYEDVYIAYNETQKSSRSVSKKILSNSPSKTSSASSDTLVNNAINTGSDSIKNIENIISATTPPIIAQPLVAATSAIEAFRFGASAVLKGQQASVQAEIKALDSPQKSTTKNTASSTVDAGKNYFLKPFKQTELLALAVTSFAFSNKFVFYALLTVVIFLLLRFIWRLVF